MKEWNGSYQFFLDYYIGGLDYSKTLKDYGLLSGRFSPSTAASKFKELKKKYPEEYMEAKQDYLQYLGISKEGIFTKVWDIANNSCRDSDRLTALSLLLKYTETSADASIINSCNKLTLEVVPAPSPLEDLCEDVIQLEGDSDVERSI